jgi:hypothetical protein
MDRPVPDDRRLANPRSALGFLQVPAYEPELVMYNRRQVARKWPGPAQKTARPLPSSYRPRRQYTLSRVVSPVDRPHGPRVELSPASRARRGPRGCPMEDRRGHPALRHHHASPTRSASPTPSRRRRDQGGRGPFPRRVRALAGGRGARADRANRGNGAPAPCSRYVAGRGLTCAYCWPPMAPRTPA